MISEKFSLTLGLPLSFRLAKMIPFSEFMALPNNALFPPGTKSPNYVPSFMLFSVSYYMMFLFTFSTSPRNVLQANENSMKPWGSREWKIDIAMH